MRYRLTPKAREDLSDIWISSAQNWGERQAELYIRTIEATLDRLTKHPALAMRCDHIRAGYQRCRVGSHVIFLKSAGDRIDVIRILHVRSDFKRHFDP